MTEYDESDWRYRGWVIVATCFVVLAIANGARSAFGVVFDPLLVEFHAPRSAISLVQSIQLLAYAVSQPVMGRFIDRYGGATVFTASLGLFGVGLVASGLSPNLLVLYATLGVAVGVGYGGISALTIAAVVSAWFERRRGFAISVANAGFNLGQLAIVPVVGVALGVVTWEGVLLGLGVATLAMVVPAYALLARGESAGSGDADATDGDGGDGQLDVASFREALLTRSFLAIAVSYLFCGITDFVVLVHLVSYLRNVGFGVTTASSALGLVGGASFAGVLVTGWFTDRMRTKHTLALLYLLRAASFLVLPLLGGLGAFDTVALYGFVVAFGFTLYATAPLTTTLTTDLYGESLMGSVYGWASSIHQVGAAAGAFLAGAAFDLLGSYQPAFYASGILVLVGAGVALLIRERAPVRRAAA